MRMFSTCSVYPAETGRVRTTANEMNKPPQSLENRPIKVIGKERQFKVCYTDKSRLLVDGPNRNHREIVILYDRPRKQTVLS